MITLEILILFFKIIGVFPFGHSRKRKIGVSARDNLFRPATAAVTYNIILMVVVCSLYIRKAVVNPGSYIEKLNADPLNDLEVNLGSVVLVILWMYFLLNRQNIVQVFDELLTTIDLLDNADVYWARRNKRYFVWPITAHVVLWIITAWFAYDAWDPENWKSSGWYFLYMLSKFVMTSCLLEYTLLCYMIRNMTQCLNTLMVGFHHLSCEYPNLQIQNFRNIRFIYGLVWDFTRAINGIFGVPMLIIIIYLCYGIIYTLSMFTLELNLGYSLLALQMYRQFYALHFTIGVTVYILIWSTTAAVREVQSLSLEILHQHLEFTANGFFNLDYPFIQHVIRATITYGILVVNLSK